MIGLKLAAVLFTLGAVGGYTGGTVVQARTPAACVDALDRANQLMNDMATFGKSSASGLGAVILGGRYDPATDSNYQKMMAETPGYKDAEARCRQ